MILVKPSYKIEAINGEDISLLEMAGRTCYKSEPKGDPAGFLKGRIKTGHLTIIEHISHCFRMKFSSYVWQQVVQIQEKTFGSQLSFCVGADECSPNGHYILFSINPRTLREAMERVNADLPSMLIDIVRDKFSPLYDDIKNTLPSVGIELLSSEEKMSIPIDIDKHNYMTVRFIADRGFTHELVRHRMAVYSQESTRWCNYSGGVTFIIPPWINIPEGEYHVPGDFPHLHNVDEYWYSSILDSERFYTTLLQHNWGPQQARSVLPNSLKTEIVMTANLQEWKLVFKQRALGLTGKPHSQMLELMVPLLAEVKTKIPGIFDDL